jgi:hypothetical protein
MLAAARRLVRAGRILAGDSRLPKRLRALAAFGLLPVPGPVDELVLAVVGLVAWLFYREPLRDAWRAAARPS